jgi:hypothetical protein
VATTAVASAPHLRRCIRAAAAEAGVPALRQQAPLLIHKPPREPKVYERPLAYCSGSSRPGEIWLARLVKLQLAKHGARLMRSAQEVCGWLAALLLLCTCQHTAARAEQTQANRYICHAASSGCPSILHTPDLET